MKCLRQNCNRIVQRNRKAKYCSNVCRNIAYRELNQSLNRRHGLSTGTMGAVSELRVAVDLLIKGYEVFRALSPSCSCDIAVLKDSHLLRIEVRTGVYNKDGSHGAPTARMRADVLAVVLHDKIVYTPEMP